MVYTDIVFDLYGTLVDIHTDENDLVWRKTALYFGYYGAKYTGAGLKKAFAAAMAEREAQAGQNYECFPDIPFEPVMAELFRKAGVTENADALGMNAAQMFRILSTDYIRFYPNVRSALRALRKKGFRLWLLSNAQRAFTAYELNHLGIAGLFDGVYISSDYGFRKPDLRFFNALIQQQNLDPIQCLMIGNDRNTDIAGAKAAGMATLYMHTNITPPGQASADPALHPLNAPAHCRHFEFEGSDWKVLGEIVALKGSALRFETQRVSKSLCDCGRFKSKI